ncbi:MAG: histidinol-phosphate transaminase [Bacteroidales bacterium]
MSEKFSIQRLVRPNIRDLVPYSSARDEFTGNAQVYLDANESPYNAPYNRYPDPKQRQLKEQMGAWMGLDAERIFLGNGSDEGIDLLFRVCCRPGGDNVVSMEPSYGMYGVCARINDVEFRRVLLNPDFTLSPEAILDRCDDRTKLIFLCSPNNPTGNVLDRAAVRQVLESAKALVVVDEAYADFSEKEGFLSLLEEFSNLVVLRTLSKAWGLAGIRLGMLFGDPILIGYLTAVKYPYNLNMLTLEAASTALQYPDRTREWVEAIARERTRMTGELQQLSLVEKVHPSDANFLLVRVTRVRELFSYLTNEGIIVRDRSSVPLCTGCLRITVGSPSENDRLLDAIKTFEKEEVK